MLIKSGRFEGQFVIYFHEQNCSELIVPIEKIYLLIYQNLL